MNISEITDYLINPNERIFTLLPVTSIDKILSEVDMQCVQSVLLERIIFKSMDSNEKADTRLSFTTEP